MPDGGSNGPDAGMTVLARVEVLNHKPNVLLLVDTSGSMTAPINPSSASCKQADGGVCGYDSPCDTSRCPTRWSEVQGAMGTFLPQNATLARLGLGTYPDISKPVSGVACGASSSLRVALPGAGAEDDATLVAKTSEVNAALQSIPNGGTGMPEGGTPTGPSLRYVGSLPELRTAERADFVLLLTDGAPNCNPNNPNPYPSAQCYCTLGDSVVCTISPYDKLGCMDQDTSVSAIQEMRSQGIRTFVVGFGPEAMSYSSPTPRALHAMATAGGIVRQCQSDTDCGAGDSCDGFRGSCQRQFYLASNGAELVSTLQRIREKLTKDSCLVRLETSGDSPWEESLQVSLDGTVVAPGPDSWSLTGEGVRFTGTACEKIAAARPTAPVLIEVRGPAPG
ncbi:adventurous gliding motility lipoprotein CglB [Archangium sp.]|uniref:adventurous gliding motility lipoprotein CglB n=1 Tax=Archangium sp. TaxID=1872627 RepID=UPI002ED7B1E6